MSDNGEPKRKTYPPKKPWQFGLRLLLLLMFGVACYFAGWSANEWRHRPNMDDNRRIEVEIAVEQSQAELASANQQLKSSERLFALGYVSQMQVQADQHKVDAARLRLQQAQAQLNAK